MKTVSSTIPVCPGVTFPRDTTRTAGPNSNVCVIGASGRGKTSSFVDANILLGGPGSIIVSDPKGGLSARYGDYLKGLGYRVLTLNFLDPKHSVGYNPFSFVKTDAEIQTISHLLVDIEPIKGNYDPFWDEAAQSLLQGLIGLMLEEGKELSFNRLLTLVTSPCSALDRAASNASRAVYRRIEMFTILPDRTRECVRGTLYSKLATFDVLNVRQILSKKDRIDLLTLDKEPTVLFLSVSDVDRSNDILASLFFTQCFQKLVEAADANKTGELKHSVRILMDDFASSVVVRDFPRYSSTIRSRRIEAQILLQSLSQLYSIYGERQAQTILDNFDTLLYLGGNDVETAEWISERTGWPVSSILGMPYGQCIVIRTGKEASMHPIFAPYENYRRIVQKEDVPPTGSAPETLKTAVGF